MSEPGRGAGDRARELHRRAAVVDGHSDILIPVAEGKMDLGDRVTVPGPEWEPRRCRV